jgi:mRNA-degrading endonuclease RelE of RelBE toxin-antitoxin system
VALATVFDGAAWQRCRTHFMRNLPFRLASLNALTELEIDPESAGKPLVGRLKGLWSARMGSYRISIQ